MSTKLTAKKFRGVGSKKPNKRNNVSYNMTPNQKKKSQELSEAINQMASRQESRATKKFEKEMDTIELVESQKENFENQKAREDKKLSKVKGFKDFNRFKFELVSESMSTYFASIVYESVPLDEDVKKFNLESIYNVAYDFYKNKVHNVTASQYTKNIEGMVNDRISVAQYNADTLPKETVANIISDIANADVYRNEVVDLVKNKVIDAVRNEGLQVKFIKQLKEEHKWYDKNKSLFRTLMEADMDILSKENTKPEILQDQAMLIATVEYTVIEALHTMKITEDVSPAKLRDGLKYAHLEKTSYEIFN